MWLDAKTKIHKRSLAINTLFINEAYGKQKVGWKTWRSGIWHLVGYFNNVGLAFFKPPFLFHEDV